MVTTPPSLLTGRHTLKQIVCCVDGHALQCDFGAHLLTCAHCRLHVELSEQEADELYMLELWPEGGCIDPVAWLPALLVTRHISIVPATTDDAKLIGVRPHDATFKWRIVPGTQTPETPRQALERKADQFEVNGGRLAKHGACIRATSQEVDGEGQPWTEYALCPQRDGTWRCSCPARVFCAHLSGYWRHLRRQLAEPEYAERAQALHVVAMLERQAGVTEEPPPHDEPAPVAWNSEKAAAQVQADGQVATEVLFG